MCIYINKRKYSYKNGENLIFCYNNILYVNMELNYLSITLKYVKHT